MLRFTKYELVTHTARVASKELCIEGLEFFVWLVLVFFLLNMDINTVTCCRSGTSSHGLSMGFL